MRKLAGEEVMDGDILLVGICKRYVGRGITVFRVARPRAMFFAHC